MSEQVVLGFDFGLRRIGVALGNSITRQARPLRVIAADTTAARWAGVAETIASWNPDQVIVGLPRHPDGGEHAMTRSARRFGRQVAGRFGVPVRFIDERYSSAVLDARQDDADAAAIILQQWFDQQCDGAAA
jgi:putative pre-16S rRNA nuclease